YLYRDATMSRPQGCRCNRVRNFSIIDRGTGRQQAESADPSIPALLVAPDQADDPQTQANRQGGLETIKPVLEPKPAAPPLAATAERKVRVVGPVFLPDPKGAIDLQAPARKQAQ